MGLLFSNYLDAGYYEEDSMGDITRLNTPDEIYNARKNGNLYEHDGFGLTKCD